MDDDSFMPRVEVLSVTDSGRRRRWTPGEKIRIVEESFSRPRNAAVTARHHDISRTLLTRWRKEYRQGLLGGEPSAVFSPVMIADERTEPKVLPSRESPVSCADTLAITLVNGRHLVVPAGIDPVILARLLPVLDGA